MTPSATPPVIAGYCLACVLAQTRTPVGADGYCPRCRWHGYYLPPDHEAVPDVAEGS